MPRYGDWELMCRLTEALDQMQGLEAQVVHRRYLGDYPHEQIAEELNIPVEMSERIALQGLRNLKDSVFRRDDGV